MIAVDPSGPVAEAVNPRASYVNDEVRPTGSVAVAIVPSGFTVNVVAPPSAATLVSRFPRSSYVRVGGAYDPSFDGGARAADAVLLADVSAVIVYNDVMAIGLVSRLAGYGVSIPAELSIIGFDDIPIASMITPPLTTVRIEREQAGRMAIEHLRDLLMARRGQIDPPPELGTELVVRGSSARAR